MPYKQSTLISGLGLNFPLPFTFTSTPVTPFAQQHAKPSLAYNNNNNNNLYLQNLPSSLSPDHPPRTVDNLPIHHGANRKAPLAPLPPDALHYLQKQVKVQPPRIHDA